MFEHNLPNKLLGSGFNSQCITKEHWAVGQLTWENED